MKGSCLCKAIMYEVDKFSGPIGHCHCNTCRKAHAAAFNTTARAGRTDFRWLTKSTLGAFESTPGKLRHFCTKCGSHLMSEWVAQPEVIVRVATLDEDPGIRPVAHIWMSDAQPWLAYDNLPAFAEWPPKK